MCHIVYIVVPESGDAARVRAIGARHGRALARSSSTLAGPGAPSSVALYHNPKRCDCGTAIGASGQVRRPWRPSDTDLRKLRRKGWSEAKIARWITDQEKSESRREARRAALQGHRGPEIENWLALLQAVLESGKADSVGLLLAWSPGPSIPLESVSRVPIGDARAELLHDAEEFVLYSFHA